MQDQLLSFGPFVLSRGKELRRDGKVVAIGQRGLLLLEAMLEADGEVVTKAEIFDKVWPGVTVEEGNITESGETEAAQRLRGAWSDYVREIDTNRRRCRGLLSEPANGKGRILRPEARVRGERRHVGGEIVCVQDIAIRELLLIQDRNRDRNVLQPLLHAPRRYYDFS